MRFKLFLALVLTLALVVTAGMMASAAPPGHARGRAPKVQSQAPTPSTVEEIRNSLPGKGNAWGRIAKELDPDRSPGSIAVLVHTLKGAAPKQPVEEPQEDTNVGLPDITDPITVTIVDILVDDDDNLTGYIVIALYDDEEEEPVLYTIELNEELLSQVALGSTLTISLDDEGDVVIEVAVEDTDEDEDTEDDNGEDDEQQGDDENSEDDDDEDEEETEE